MRLPTIRRGPIEIYFDLLTTCLRPRKKTHIMRHANIQFNSLSKFLFPLIDEGYINNSENSYQTSIEGIDLIKNIRLVASKLKLEGFDIPVEMSR